MKTPTELENFLATASDERLKSFVEFANKKGGLNIDQIKRANKGDEINIVITGCGL